MNWKSALKRHSHLYHALKSALARASDARARLTGRPRARIPRKLRRDFTLNGRIQVLYGYADNSRNRPITYAPAQIDAACSRIAAGELGHYRQVDAWLYEALQRHSIRGKHVAIMGSADQGFGPWYECVALQHGARPTTIDYNPIDFRDPRLHFLKAPIDIATVPPFDAALSVSSFEHDGLGRYGDPLDPNADLKAMRQMKRLLKQDGLLFLTVPLGRDKVVFNIHRIYGRIRLPLLLEGWTVMDRFGFDDALLDRDTGYGWEPTRFMRGPRGVEEQPIHPECPSYEPVWVLRNSTPFTSDVER